MSEEKIKACPFCGVEAMAHDGDWVVNHKTDCFFTQHYAQEMWLVGKKKVNYWNERAGDREPAVSKTPEPSTLASATGYTALELLQTMCELRRNMDAAVDEINGESYARAALYLECAASKLRTIQRAVDAV